MVVEGKKEVGKSIWGEGEVYILCGRGKCEENVSEFGGVHGPAASKGVWGERNAVGEAGERNAGEAGSLRSLASRAGVENRGAGLEVCTAARGRLAALEVCTAAPKFALLGALRAELLGFPCGKPRPAASRLVGALRAKLLGGQGVRFARQLSLPTLATRQQLAPLVALRTPSLRSCILAMLGTRRGFGPHFNKKSDTPCGKKLGRQL
ncbi:hypothetical protein DFP72DRAFT_1146962 [Ephemerocybe angulata]|uniref:Uncharacterized protein n=1 Tax=Ephemerocybe angulata TaxID=980116 RepID=A0A8H6HIZ8_9AGAR|nr:hypothetical protein DFP72DRAFT_1146962 [Tulosesus angulatus]